MQKKVFVVDDERGVRESMRMLLKDDFQVKTASSGSEALAILGEVQPDIVLLDLRMPDMNGIDVLQRIKAMEPNIEVILVTAYATVSTARKALLLGAFDYLTKPFDPIELQSIVRRGIDHREDALRRTATMEAVLLDYRSLRQEVEMDKHQILNHVRDTVYALLMTLEMRDAYSGQHSMAVLWLVDQFSITLGIDPAERNRLRRAALVHDLGKIGIPEEILNKPESLHPEEMRVMRTHPKLSEEIILNVEALTDLGPIVRSHHERWDGDGYPDQLAGDDIPWQSQILAVCDSVHAMGSERRYRASLPEAIIRRELSSQRGRQFKPEYVDVMLASTLINEIYEAEHAGKLILNSQQIRMVLAEPTVDEPLPNITLTVSGS